MTCDTVHRLAIPPVQKTCMQKACAQQSPVPAKAQPHSFIGWLHRILAALREARLRRLSIQDLQRLRDQDLRDIGISRAEIEDTVDRMLRQARDRR